MARYKLNLRNSLHYKHVDTKKEVNSNIHLLLSHCYLLHKVIIF